MKRKLWRWIAVITAAAFAIALSLVILRTLRTPPIDTLTRAYDSIARARSAGAHVHAQSLLREADSLLRHGEQALAEENAKWLPFWSYRHADSLLARAIELADSAAQSAKLRRSTQRAKVESGLTALNDSLSLWRKRLDSELIRKDCEALWTSAKSQRDIGLALLNRGLDDEAGFYSDSAGQLLSRLAERHNQYLKSSRQQMADWHRWVNETRRLSAQTGDPAIIVDKSAHRLFVLIDGKITASYPCDLGHNSAYQKRRAGDGATPEGMYQVVALRHSSKYYKALLLNYPNDSDKERFRKNVQSGAISKSSRIGGLIEIHGQGGSGKDWTDGCVAVADEHMDRLLKIARIGTPVTIVRKSDLTP
jgi:lipoprotein-anchoring transpeptidase ErfK/SrfK